MDGSWSAVASMYPEDCVDHFTVRLAVFFMLFFIVVSVGICVWYARWDWQAIKDGSFPSNPGYPSAERYQTTRGTPYGTRSYIVLPVKPPI